MIEIQTQHGMKNEVQPSSQCGKFCWLSVFHPSDVLRVFLACVVSLGPDATVATTMVRRRSVSSVGWFMYR